MVIDNVKERVQVPRRPHGGHVLPDVLAERGVRDGSHAREAPQAAVLGPGANNIEDT